MDIIWSATGHEYVPSVQWSAPTGGVYVSGGVAAIQGNGQGTGAGTLPALTSPLTINLSQALGNYSAFQAIPEDGFVTLGIVDGWWGFDVTQFVTSARFEYDGNLAGGGRADFSLVTAVDVKTTADETGTISLGEIEHGQTVRVNAGDRAQTFAGWTGATFAAANSVMTTFEMPSSATTVTAAWGDPIPQSLTVIAGTGGTVSSHPATVTPGTSVTVTATPNAGQEFVNWSGDGLALPSTTNPLIFDMPTIPVNLTANFRAEQQTFIGTVTISGNPVFGQTLTAVTTGLTPQLTWRYQWRRGASNITGANGATYMLTEADIGSQISVVVTADNSGSTEASAPTAAVTRAPSVWAPPTGPFNPTWTSGLTLANIALPTGYAWVAPSTPITAVGVQGFAATFTQSVNHLPEQGTVTVDVQRATIPPIGNQPRMVHFMDDAQKTVDIAALVSAYPGEKTYLLGTVTGAVGIIGNAAVSLAGMLSFNIVPPPAYASQTATIPVTVSGFATYNPITINVVVTLTDKTPVTITAATPDTVYNRQPYAGLTGITSGAFTGTLEREYRGTGSTTYGPSSTAPTNAGTYNVTLSVPDSDATFAGSNVFPFAITPAPLTITGVSAINRDYDGTVTVALTGGALQGVIAGDTVTFDLGTGTMLNTSIGSNKVVNTNIQLTGAQAGNYVLTQPTNIRVNILGVLIGDVDGDGVIDSADVTLLRRYIAQEFKSEDDRKNWMDANGFDPANADVNGDGVIDAEDVSLLRRWIAAYLKFQLGVPSQQPITQ
jgi:hypothetical protein